MFQFKAMLFTWCSRSSDASTLMWKRRSNCSNVAAASTISLLEATVDGLQMKHFFCQSSWIPKQWHSIQTKIDLRVKCTLLDVPIALIVRCDSHNMFYLKLTFILFLNEINRIIKPKSYRLHLVVLPNRLAKVQQPPMFHKHSVK